MKDHHLQAWLTTSEEKGHPRRACSLFIVQWIAFLAFVGLSALRLPRKMHVLNRARSVRRLP